MNKVILMGRLTKDPEVKKTQSNLSVCSFSIAVDRRFKDSNGNKQTDFINCVAWRTAADIIGNYFHKGSRILVTGSLQSRSYDDQAGNKRTVIEVLVEEVEFVDPKQTQGQAQTQEEVRPIPPMPQMPGEEEAAIMQAEADAAEVEESLPFSLDGTFDF